MRRNKTLRPSDDLLHDPKVLLDQSTDKTEFLRVWRQVGVALFNAKYPAPRRRPGRKSLQTRVFTVIDHVYPTWDRRRRQRSLTRLAEAALKEFARRYPGVECKVSTMSRYVVQYFLQRKDPDDAPQSWRRRVAPTGEVPQQFGIWRRILTSAQWKALLTFAGTERGVQRYLDKLHQCFFDPRVQPPVGPPGAPSLRAAIRDAQVTHLLDGLSWAEKNPHLLAPLPRSS